MEIQTSPRLIAGSVVRAGYTMSGRKGSHSKKTYTFLVYSLRPHNVWESCNPREIRYRVWRTSLDAYVTKKNKPTIPDMYEKQGLIVGPGVCPSALPVGGVGCYSKVQYRLTQCQQRAEGDDMGTFSVRDGLESMGVDGGTLTSR